MRSAWNVRVAGVEARFAARDRGAHHFGQLAGGGERPAALRRGDGAGDAAGESLFAQRADQRAELALRQAGDEVGGGFAVAAHPHVERSVLAERKPALGLVELHRRDAEVEGDAGDRPRLERPEQPLHVAERAGDQGQAAAVLRRQRLAALDRVGVAVDAEHAAARGAEDRLAIAAGAKGRVDIDRVVARAERGQNRVDQYGDMGRGFGHRR